MKNFLPSLQIVFSLIWLSILSDTDAYFSVYVIIAFFSFWLQVHHGGDDGFTKMRGMVLLFAGSAVFSFVVILANYPIFTTIGDPALIGRSTSFFINLINCVFSFIGGICVSYPIFRFIFCRFPVSSVPISEDSGKTKWLPLLIFFSFALINLVHLFFVEYPGNMTEDTFTQISEMVSGDFSNFNTFWHTMIFRGIMTIGYTLFSDLSAAAAFFCTLQALMLCGAFTHCLMTMYHYGIPKPFVFGAFLIYAFVPYNIALSITIWKDVLFAAGCLLLISSWLRVLKSFGNQLWNYFVFTLGSLLFILSRTIGWMIYLVTFLLVIFVCRKNRKFLILMASLALCGWALLNPVLTAMQIPGSDSVESLSIPIQQVSRVIVDGSSLSDADSELLSHVVDLDEVPSLYISWLSDPMKEEIRSKDLSYFESHLSDYVNLWIRLGLKHPASYLKAWIDQTKGYWNAGYDYFLYAETITDNSYGVEKTAGGNPIASMFSLYFGLSRHIIFFEPLHSIGLHVWILILCFLLNLLKRREEWVISVPVLLLVAGLWIGTPVYCSFRYVYPLFVSFPLILSTAFYSRNST